VKRTKLSSCQLIKSQSEWGLSSFVYILYVHTTFLCETSAEPFEQFGMHLMRLTGSEAQNDKSFKFDDNHDFYSIVQHDDRVVLFASRQIGDVKRGYIYQMCHNDPGTKESGNSFSQIEPKLNLSAHTKAKFTAILSRLKR
jgi:hypothetical protein